MCCIRFTTVCHRLALIESMPCRIQRWLTSFVTTLEPFIGWSERARARGMDERAQAENIAFQSESNIRLSPDYRQIKWNKWNKWCEVIFMLFFFFLSMAVARAFYFLPLSAIHTQYSFGVHLLSTVIESVDILPYCFPYFCVCFIHSRKSTNYRDNSNVKSNTSISIFVLYQKLELFSIRINMVDISYRCWLECCWL